MTLSITFDSNVLENVIDFERIQAKEFREDYLIIQRAIKERKIQGFFSDTWITLEGIENKNRCQILGSRRLVSSSESSNKLGNSPIVITINVGTTMEKNQLHQKHEAPKNAALSLGLRALSGTRNLGDNFLVNDNDGSFYGNIPIEELIKYSEKLCEVEVSIAKRCCNTKINVAKSKALKLGLAYLEREQLSNCL